MKAIEGTTIGETWLAAAEHLAAAPSREAFNMVLEVKQPAVRPPSDRIIIKAVDELLRSHDRFPVNTVAETIFPFSAYRRHGADGVYTTYPDTIFPAIKRLKEVHWGTYAHRLVRWPTPTGDVNQIEKVVRKIRGQQKKGAKPYTASYELATSTQSEEALDTEGNGLDLSLYDPNKDANQYYGGQCLSHISIKVRDGKEVLLTAMYRRHHYVEKALGNLLGLSHLQGFICNETGLGPGPLVCVSTYAVLDNGAGKTGSPSWGVAAMNMLLTSVRSKVTAMGGAVANAV